MKCGEEPGTKYLTGSQESEYCDAFRFYLQGSSIWKPHHLETIAREAHILKLRAQVLAKLKALAPPSLSASHLSAGVDQPTSPEEMFDFEIFVDGRFSQTWKPQKGLFRNGVLWTGSSEKSIFKRLEACTPDKDKQHNFHCLDCVFDEGTISQGGKDHVLRFKKESESRQYCFAFSSASARLKCLEMFANLPTLEDYTDTDSAPSVSVSFFAEFDGVEMSLRVSQNERGDCAKLQLLNARFELENRLDEGVCAKFSVENLYGVMALEKSNSSYQFLTTSTLHGSSNDTNFVSVKYVLSSTVNSLQVQCLNSTDICVNPLFQDFLHSWWEFANNDRGGHDSTSLPMKGSSSASTKASSLTSPVERTIVERQTSIPLDIRVTVHAPRCIFVSGCQALIICLGTFQFGNAQSSSMHCEEAQSLATHFHFSAAGYSLTYVTFSDSSLMPDCSTDFSTNVKRSTVIIETCPFSLDLMFSDESLNTDANSLVRIHFSEPLYLSLDHAFVSFAMSEILPVVNRLSLQSAIFAEFLFNLFNDNSGDFSELTHGQQTEMLARLRLENHPEYERMNQQYELARESENSDSVLIFCTELCRMYRCVLQKEASHRVVLIFDEYIGLNLKMNNHTSDQRAAAFRIIFPSKSVELIAKTLGANIDISLTQHVPLRCSILTVDEKIETDFIRANSLLTSSNFIIRETQVKSSLALSSESIKASVSPQQVEFFTHLLRGFQAAMSNAADDKHIISKDGDTVVIAPKVAEVSCGATKTTQFSIVVQLTKIEVDLKSEVHQHNEQLRILCEEIVTIMESKTSEFGDQPTHQATVIDFSMQNIQIRSFCSSRDGLDLVHIDSAEGNSDIVSRQFLCFHMTTEQRELKKSSAEFSSQNAISIESKRPLIFVIDALSICKLYELSMKLVDAAGNPDIIITSTYVIDLSFKKLSLDLIISDEKHFRMSFCLPQDESKSTNRVISGQGCHRSANCLFIGNMMFGVFLIPNTDLQAATCHSQIIENVSFSVSFEVGEQVATSSCSIKIMGGIDAAISYQDIQQLYLFMFHPSRGLLPCWLETNGILQPTDSNPAVSQKSFEFRLEIPASVSMGFANDCPPYSESLLRIEMQQLVVKCTSSAALLTFENLLLSCGLDSNVSFEGSLTQYRERVGEHLHGFVTGSLHGLVCGCGNTYSDDSDVATAAVHSGVCGVSERKKVCIQLLGPVEGLQSSRSNGVSSRACANWPGSFSFVGHDTVSPNFQLLAVSKCQVSYNALDDIAEIDSSSKIQISVSLPVADKLRQRMEYVLKDWEHFQSEDHPHHYSGHVYARLHNKSDSLFTIRHETYGPQLLVPRCEHVDLDHTWFPNFVLLHGQHEAVVNFQESAFPALHFEFHTKPDSPRYHLYVYSQVVLENRTSIPFIVSESSPDGARQSLLPLNERFSTSLASAETLTINCGACSISSDLRSLPVHSHSILARDCLQSSAFGCIQHQASQLFLYPEGGRRLVLKAMVNGNQEGYVFRLCRDGSLQHVETGLLVHPEGGAGVAQAQLVLHEDGSEPRLWFAFSQGCIRHLASGLYVHPARGRAFPNDPVMLHPGGPDTAFEGQIFFNFVAIPPNSEPEVEPEPLAISAPGTPSFLRHTHTSMYVHPEGGTALCNVRLVLWPGHHNNERRLMFALRPDGNLQHVDSGLFVHPKGGKAKSGIELILHPDGPEPRLAFYHDSAGCFRHCETGLYVHPKNGKGKQGCPLIFHPDDASRAFPGELFYAVEPAQTTIVKFSPSAGRLPKVVGNLRHALSHLYVHPEGGLGVSGARLVLWNEGNQRRLNFVLRNDGCIQHAESGLFVHPRGGTAKFGADLILHPDGPREGLAFELEPSFGCLRHIQSGLYVHPAGGDGRHGVHLCLHNVGPEPRLVYEFMPIKFDMSISNSYHGPISLGHVNGVSQSMWCCSKQIAGGAVSLRTYVPSLFLQSELSRPCEIHLFSMSSADADPLPLLQIDLSAGYRLPCMTSCERMGLRISFDDGFLISNVTQITWQNLLLGQCHTFGCCGIELRGEGGLSKWINLYWSMTEHGSHVLHIAQTIDIRNSLSFPLRLCLSKATETSPHIRIPASTASNASAVSIGFPTGWQFSNHRTLMLASETNAEAHDFQPLEIPLDSHCSGVLVHRGARFRVHVELHYHPAGQSNPVLCFSPQHSMINASTLQLRVLSQDAAASCIDIPSASAAKTSCSHALPIFWEPRGGFSIACKVQKSESSEHEWSRFHSLFAGDNLEPTDVVFRDEGGQIVGCVSVEVVQKVEGGDAGEEKKSITVIVRDSSALCR